LTRAAGSSLRRLNEVVAFHLQAVAAGGGDAGELSEDPVGGGQHAGARGRSVSRLEMVLRLPKVTSLAMSE
jgi:hypothetical protein